MASYTAPPAYTPFPEYHTDELPSFQHANGSEKPVVASDLRPSPQVEIKSTDRAGVDNLTSSFGNIAVSHDRSMGGTHRGAARCSSSYQPRRGCCRGRSQRIRGCQGPISWAVVTLFTTAKTAHERYQAEKNERAERIKAEIYKHSGAAHGIERGEKNERPAFLDLDRKSQDSPHSNQIAALVQVELRIRRESMSCCQAMKARWTVMQSDRRYTKVEEQVAVGKLTRCQAKTEKRAIWRAQKKESREVRKQLGYGCC
ncbi:MAG: hypothetical protein M1812_000269 [Candelaria pacifica]|nr:MAG: hypothetical protein M1812_000269 [Candelaria pacifica]